MIRRPEPLLTLADLDGLPDDAMRYSLRRGHLVAEPPPGFAHGRVAARIVCALDAWCVERAAGVVVTCDVGFVLAHEPDTLLAPDVAFLSTDTLERVTDERRSVPGPPDLAVEVLSPSDRAGTVRQKTADWLEAGAQRVWVVDPQERRIHVRGNAGVRTFDIRDVLTDTDLLPDFALPVINVFGWRAE